MSDYITIPDSWQQIRVDDISLRIHYGFTASSTKRNTGIKFLRITDIQEYKVAWEQVPFCEIDEYDINKYLLEEGDIVFARTGATVGKSFLLQGVIPQAIFASYLIRIQLSKNIDPKYLFYFFQSADYWKQIGARSSGIGQPSVNASSLSGISLFLSPVNEQTRIVSKIEELFSELDNAETSLKNAQKQLAIYRQGLLKSAFEGRLTAKWRHLNQSGGASEVLQATIAKRQNTFQIELVAWEKLRKSRKTKNAKKPSKPIPPPQVVPFSSSELIDRPVLPDQWAWVKTQQIADVIMGQSPAGATYNDKGKGVPLINGPAEFGPTPFSFTIPSKWTTAPTKMCEVGDLILCVRGSTTGRQNIAGSKACLGRGVAALRAIIANQKYLNHYFNYIHREIFEIGTGTTFPSVSHDQLTSFAIPICSADEQNQIVQEVEYRLTISDNLEDTIKENLKQVEVFRHSVLQKAFRGYLVHQDPEDETVTKLLQKIRKEKEEYESNLEISTRNRPKRPKIMEIPKSILEILKSSDGPMSAKEIWINSEHKFDIDKFYSSLKQHVEDGEIMELPRNGKESLLTLAKDK